MIEEELLEKNRFTKEEYEKKVKEQFHQMLENDLKKNKKKPKKQDADLRKLKKAVQNKKYVDEFVKKLLKGEKQWLNWFYAI